MSRPATPIADALIASEEARRQYLGIDAGPWFRAVVEMVRHAERDGQDGIAALRDLLLNEAHRKDVEFATQLRQRVEGTL